MTAQTRHRRLEILAWLAALAIAFATLGATAYRSRDPDSRLHVDIEGDLSRLPPERWIAPEWNGHWDSEGLYREHPVGIFLLPVLLSRCGYPTASAGYAANAIYQVLTVVLVTGLAGLYVQRSHARALGWLLLWLPVAFTYRIRANHEQALLLCLIAALYGTSRSRESLRWGLLTVVGVCGALLVKGLFAAPVVLACVVWILATRPPAGGGTRAADGLPAPDRPPANNRPRPADRPPAERRWSGEGLAWAALALAIAAGAVVIVGYEALYRATTGESFLTEYLRRQIGPASLQQSGWVVPQKIYNVGAYLARVIWFAAPWSLVLAVAPWWRRPIGRAARETAGDDRSWRVRFRASEGARALLAALLSSAAWIMLVSLSDRRTDRYIFPTYFLVGGAGAALALQRSAVLQRWTARAERIAPFERPGVWLALFFVHLGSIPLELPFINW